MPCPTSAWTGRGKSLAAGGALAGGATRGRGGPQPVAPASLPAPEEAAIGPTEELEGTQLHQGPVEREHPGPEPDGQAWEAPLGLPIGGQGKDLGLHGACPLRKAWRACLMWASL